MDTLKLAIGWAVLVLVAVLIILALYGIFAKKPILANLVCDETGDASMGRFQALVFTVVIALSYLYLVMTPGAAGLPEVPGSVLAMLGISGSTFLVSKGIDK